MRACDAHFGRTVVPGVSVVEVPNVVRCDVPVDHGLQHMRDKVLLAGRLHDFRVLPHLEDELVLLRCDVLREDLLCVLDPLQVALALLLGCPVGRVGTHGLRALALRLRRRG